MKFFCNYCSRRRRIIIIIILWTVQIIALPSPAPPILAACKRVLGLSNGLHGKYCH
jgi:hypothetical protein